MQRLPVESSDIVSIGYDPKDHVLEIEFRGQRLYRYLDVESAVYERFMRADSFGTYFFAHINGRYRYERVRGEDEAADDPAALAFVSANRIKFAELEEACKKYDIAVELLDLPVDEIQSDDPLDIAVKKAKQAFRLAGRPVVVQESYWNILALKGFPGAYQSSIARWLSPQDILRLMEGKENRAICLSKTVVYFDGKKPKSFTKDYWGTITEAPSGEGSGFSPIVILAGQAKTIADVSSEGKWNIAPSDSVWHDFAKWYNLYSKFGRR